MTSETIDNTLDEAETKDEAAVLAVATDLCSKAEADFADGNLGIDSLLAVYQQVVPDYAHQSAYSGDWARLERRASRLSRLLTGTGIRWNELRMLTARSGQLHAVEENRILAHLQSSLQIVSVWKVLSKVV